MLKVHCLPLIYRDLHHDEIYNLGTWLLILGICFRKLLLFYKIRFYRICFICLLLMTLLRQVKNAMDSYFIFFLESNYFSKTHHRIQINSIVVFVAVMKKICFIPCCCIFSDCFYKSVKNPRFLDGCCCFWL